MTDPMDKIVAEALRAAGFQFETGEGGGNPIGLDFFLPGADVHIEVKRFHSDRIGEQMSRATNVIALQGEKAVNLFSQIIVQTAEAMRVHRTLALTDACEPIAHAIRDADASFGYEITLVRLVEGESTYRLRMIQGDTDHSTYSEALALATHRRDRARATAILLALRAPLASFVITDDLVELGVAGIKHRDADGWSDDVDEDQINRELAKAVLKGVAAREELRQ